MAKNSEKSNPIENFVGMSAHPYQPLQSANVTLRRVIKPMTLTQIRYAMKKEIPVVVVRRNENEHREVAVGIPKSVTIDAFGKIDVELKLDGCYTGEGYADEYSYDCDFGCYNALRCAKIYKLVNEAIADCEREHKLLESILKIVTVDKG